MEPATGDRLLRFVGDRLRFRLRTEKGPPPPGLPAFLRTTLGRADLVRREVLGGQGQDRAVDGTAWRNIPMRRTSDGWELDLTLTEPGYFRAKAFALDERGFQVWPAGEDAGVTVHPSAGRTTNILYCAFTRLFGATQGLTDTRDRRMETRLKTLEAQGFSVIPASGKFRDLIPKLPHIVGTLGCRILHLLPVNPTPTTYARFGRFGSPYAAQDLTAIDPALVEFDRRATAADQFGELAYAAHAHGARVFLDLVINHTGWDSWLLNHHPDWFHRNPDGTFQSPGAWGVTWEDLVELEGSHRGLWEHIAEAFLTWCRRGVDGFRCDAGYKVPMPVWRYIIARVREEFPEAVFLLEGLGGAWSATETLLTEGGMQWAYSELFQEYSGLQVAGYLDHAWKQTARVGLLVHYSETHDNDRLARKGRAWSLLRNRLSALTSVSGGFGFTCGVEWLAQEKIDVHGCTGLAWGAPDNLVAELATLNRLLAGHPCFFDGAQLTRITPPESPVLALRRSSAEGLDHVLVLVNTDAEHPQALALPEDSLAIFRNEAEAWLDLLGQPAPEVHRNGAGFAEVRLEPAAAYCLASRLDPAGLGGDAYRDARARASFVIQALSERFDPEAIGPFDPSALGALLEPDPAACLSAAANVDPDRLREDAVGALRLALESPRYPAVVRWGLADPSRITPVPPEHWLLVEDVVPFRAALQAENDGTARHAESLRIGERHFAAFAPGHPPGPAQLHLERYTTEARRVTGRLRLLAPEPEPVSEQDLSPTPLALLTNGRGGMARLSADFGRITSKYDCLLGANLHPSLPVDRHILAKRARLWINAYGFISALNADNLIAFGPGPTARWLFRANAGDGRTVDIEVTATMIPQRNTTRLQLRHVASGLLADAPRAKAASGLEGIRATVRVDIEDRNFHWETKRNGGAEHHFQAHTRALAERPGFEFAPAADRRLRVFSSIGHYHPSPEWCDHIPHPVEASRGQEASGDAYSPGWFDLPLDQGQSVALTVTAETGDADGVVVAAVPGSGEPADGSFRGTLACAAEAFVVRRDDVKTVVAGYPWFLDWGRDTLICARGLITAGRLDTVRELLVAFGRFEERGTLPNIIHGEQAGNRDTVDAPLWYGLVCEELAAATGDSAAVYALQVNAQGRTVADVLESIATHYWHGTANGIRVDPESALVWSPSHFTWMDTNYPAGTPREGYPVEIQALWIRLLRQLAERGRVAPIESWGALARRGEAHLHRLFWLESQGMLSDVLLAGARVPASQATPDTALRSNSLLAISTGLLQGEPARRCVAAAQRHLLVPGALRSLAPLPVSPPLPIHAADGRLLNHPDRPYCGHYEGDEDTRRKPAYHNGTAWVWTLPTFCEALVRAWDHAPTAVAAARAYLAATDQLLAEGCRGQLPEIIDGDAPHTQRGCDAQAWSVTETLRVWHWLNTLSTQAPKP